MYKGRNGFVSKKEFASVVGYCSSCCLALPQGRFHLTAMYADLHSVEGWSKNIVIRLKNKSI